MILHYNDANNNDFDLAIELIKEKKLKGLICLGGDFNTLDKEQIRKKFKYYGSICNYQKNN